MDKCRSCRHYIIKERSGDMCIWGCELSTCVINDFGKTLNGEPVIVYASELKYGDAADIKTHVNLKIIEELEKIKTDIMKNSCYLCKDFSGNIQCGKYADIHFCKTKEHIRIINAHIAELKGEQE